MPELPDVETFKRYIDATSLHEPIEAVEVLDGRILEGVGSRKFTRTVTGTSFEETARHGKHLFVRCSDSMWMMIHFGMTGYVSYFKNDPGLSHVKILFSFGNGYRLAYINQRLFGRIALTTGPDEFVARKGLGPDALAIGEDAFSEILTGRGSVKSRLMNQKVLAGLGNVYVDEILFHSRMHPETPLSKLDSGDVGRIYDAMNTVLSISLEHRARPDDLPETFLIHHREKGADCPVCGGTMERIKVGGRSTYFCPACQKKPR